MEYASIALVLGALFRRYWGGWTSPDSTVKRLIGFFLPLSVCLLMGFPLLLCVVLSAILSLGWMMPYHGYGISMGRNPKTRPAWLCFCVMAAQYGGVTLLAGIVWEKLLPHTGGLIYAPMGILVAVGYYLGWKAWEKFNLKPWGEYPKGNWFVDSAANYGELVLGMVLLGGLTVAHLCG